MARVDLSFKKGDSLFHRMTPFSKLLFVLSVSFVAIFNTNLYVGAGLFVLCLIIALFFTSVPIKEYWALGKIIIPFIAILAVVFPFFYGGQATVGSDAIALRTPIKDLSWAALGFGALLALRFLALATAGLAFAFTTHPTDLVERGSGNFSDEHVRVGSCRGCGPGERAGRPSRAPGGCTSLAHCR